MEDDMKIASERKSLLPKLESISSATESAMRESKGIHNEPVRASSQMPQNSFLDLDPPILTLMTLETG
ncbi:hypothetical protein K439DRAFT_1641769 [Ramaria rubella]|nr:hypothetical protein K439DRAFT_1641769 [Ramaria rubella]